MLHGNCIARMVALMPEAAIYVFGERLDSRPWNMFWANRR
jgi:hypothetical protein